MNRRRMTVVALLLLVLALPVPAYPPVVVGGAAGYVGDGSDSSLVWSFGPQLDIDYRGPLGGNAYFGAWYSGELWFAGSTLTPLDRHLLGLLAGGPVGRLELEARTAADLSSPLGDGQLSVIPDWGLSASAAVAENLSLDVDYEGMAQLEPGTDRGRVHHHVNLTAAYDPSIELGLRGGGGGYITSFTDRFVLDADGFPGATLRTDIGAEVAIGAEGLAGYFTLWDAKLSAGLVESNANRWLPLTSTVESNSADRLIGGAELFLSSNPVRTLGIECRLDCTGSWYASRSALDGTGAVIAPVTKALVTEGNAQMDWNPVSGLFLILGVSGEYSLSNDAGMSGWNWTANTAVQYRF